ncbi:hypothetical protein G4B88_021538 [Cannabis sativa]|uniref:DUF4283 domain-containing protein n=1 Tax=Cannabis sativa TaxID=3483 RepID=A0A7J6GIJ9_CANSA|nr:hypothetical protein G4B88_021538 [Cannabis sativa]
MEDLLDQTGNLRVEDEDGWEVNEERESEVGKSCLLGRFCSNKNMNRNLIRTILGRVWGLAEVDWGVKIKKVTTEASFLIFSFKNESDLSRIVNKSPWMLNNGVLILQRFSKLPSKWEEEMNRFPLMGRVLNLPTKAITKNNMLRLASMAGEVIEIQKEEVTKITVNAAFGAWLKIDDKSLGQKKITANTDAGDNGINFIQPAGSFKGNRELEKFQSVEVKTWNSGHTSGGIQESDSTPRITNQNSLRGEVPISKTSFPFEFVNLMDNFDAKRVGKDFEKEGGSGVKRRADSCEIWNRGTGLVNETGKRFHREDKGVQERSEVLVSNKGEEWIDIPITLDRSFGSEKSGQKGGRKKRVVAKKNGQEARKSRFTGFYGSPDPGGRKFTWQLMERLRDLIQGAWVCGGDFNEVLKVEEKKGGCLKNDSQIRDFQRAISYCNFKEIRMSVGEFTWCNGGQQSLVFEKLDRVMANTKWIQSFCESSVTLLPWWSSDHRPMILTFSHVKDQANKTSNWRSRFHYEQAWAEEEDCGRIVESVWLDNSNWGSPQGVRGREWNIETLKETMHEDDIPWILGIQTRKDGGEDDRIRIKITLKTSQLRRVEDGQALR